MPTVRTSPLACLGLVLLLAGPLASTAMAAKAPATGAARKKTTKVKIPKPETGESAGERRQRWSRECRGLPNAGACLGYGYGS